MFFLPVTLPHLRRTLLKSGFSLGACFALLTSGCVDYSPRPIDPEVSARALQSRSLDDAGLRDFLRRNQQPAPGPGEPWELEALALAGIYFNPSLAVARAQFVSSTAAKKTAAARPNPTIGPSLGYDQNPGAGISPWFPGINLDWPIETAGKRGARIDKADFTAESMRQSLFDSAWSVRRTVRTAYLDVVAAESRAEVIKRIDEANARTIELLNERLKVGMISVHEASAARLNGQRAHFDAGEAERASHSARVRLAEAIGLPASALERVALQRESPHTEISPEEIVTARSLALRSRPDILAALADYRSSEVALKLEVARQYPDFHFNPGYLWDLGERKWSIGLTFELPILNRNEGPIAEAKAQRDERAARFDATQAKVLAELDAAESNYTQTTEQLARARAVRSTADAQQRTVEKERIAGEADALQQQGMTIESLNALLLERDAENAVLAARAFWEDTVRQPLAQISSLANQPVTSR